MRILVTGGAGYIGSHVCLELLQSGHDVVVVDNLETSNQESLCRVQKLAQRSFQFYKADVRDEAALQLIFDSAPIDAVIHLAGLKAVGESAEIPLTYYSCNLAGTLTLCQVMQRNRVKSLVFSSSATVYGTPEAVPVQETAPLAPTNPYGHTKAMAEEILRDLGASDPGWHIALLRYFNPVGAHPSGEIGESPLETPSNLFPYMAQVATGKYPHLNIYGDDYPTCDGTGVRDYIHIVDLARGHLKALEALGRKPGTHAYNLGTGHGYSVKQILNEFSNVIGQPVPFRIAPRRAGDAATSYAEVSKARQELGWSAQLGLKEMCADLWRWQSQNPEGYGHRP